MPGKASSSVAASAAIALWQGENGGGRGGGKGSGSSVPVTEAQAQSKRDAAKRTSLLAKAPDFVRAKWDAIAALKGRDRNKNKQKQDFSMALFKDSGDYTDAYWQRAVTDRYVQSDKIKGTWMVRSKAEASHGGGETGRRAVQDCIDAGVYATETKEVKKDGRAIKIEYVKVATVSSEQMQEQAMEDKVRGGRAITSEEFQNRAFEMLAEGPLMKRPSGTLTLESGGSMLALLDKSKKAQDDTSGAKSVKVLKRPAGASSEEGVLKKPAAAVASLSKQNVEAHDKEVAEQNDKLNLCVRTSVKHLDAQLQKMEETCYHLENLQLEGRMEKSRGLTVEAMKEKIGELNERKEKMKKILFQQQAVQHSDAKVDALGYAGALLSEAKDVQGDASKLLNKASGDAAASTKKGD